MRERLAEFGVNEFDLAAPVEGGGTKRDHLEAAQRATRKPMEELQMQCPPGMLHLWGYFCELSNARHSGQSITFSEIKAWSDLCGVVLTPYEIGVIRRLDREFLAKKK